MAALTCTIKSSVASCNASSPSTVHRNGSGATLLVISRACRRQQQRPCQETTEGSPTGHALPSKPATVAVHLRPVRTRRAKGILRISKLVLRWYLRISRSATVPGRKRCGFSAALNTRGSAHNGLHPRTTGHQHCVAAPCGGLGNNRRRPTWCCCLYCRRLSLHRRLALASRCLLRRPLGRALQENRKRRSGLFAMQCDRFCGVSERVSGTDRLLLLGSRHGFATAVGGAAPSALRCATRKCWNAVPDGSRLTGQVVLPHVPLYHTQLPHILTAFFSL